MFCTIKLAEHRLSFLLLMKLAAEMADNKTRRIIVKWVAIPIAKNRLNDLYQSNFHRLKYLTPKP